VRQLPAHAFAWPGRPPHRRTGRLGLR
jgi:hypothetical protein